MLNRITLALLKIILLAAMVGGMDVRAVETDSLRSLGLSKPLSLMFTSGHGQETGRQKVHLNLKPGRYQLTFEQAGARYSDQWLIWDYLELRAQNGKLVWNIGKDDVGRAPPDYSAAAFAELAPATDSSATTRFIVGQTDQKNFCREFKRLQPQTKFCRI